MFQERDFVAAVAMNDQTPDSLQRLLAACAAGDTGAFRVLYRATSATLYGIVKRLVRRDDWAADVLQEGYWRIWRHAGDYNPARGAAMTWMMSIVRHAALDRLRAARREAAREASPEEFPDGIPEEIGEEMADVERARDLRTCLETLDAGPRRAILLAYYHGYSHGELARALAAPVGTVKSWIRRGTTRLGACLEGK
jgi:RNA polymerase sigma-70 factor (ECF subfamily)